MRKAMIEKMLEKAMCYDGKVIKDGYALIMV